MYTLHLGNCVSILPTLPENSIDSIVCDPPYELGFMGKSWDASGIAYSVKMWQEALRVLKPGGHLLAFSGSRTYHRMTCAIEDAGFEVRDQILWVYGSGFPKSLDVSKAIDKAAGAEREVIGTQTITGMKPDRETFGANDRSGGKGMGFRPGEHEITAPATPAAKQWQGWGTALKPAHEPICVARKPLVKGLTVAANVLAHGTGALNIDGCRVPGVLEGDPNRFRKTDGGDFVHKLDTAPVVRQEGRWPANLIHDGSEEVLALFPNTAPSKASKRGDGIGKGFGGSDAEYDTVRGHSDNGGSAARFFYCAKTSKKDRNEGCEALPQKAGGMVSNTSGQHITRRDEGYEPKPQGNNHPTVKPTDLMRYLCRLVTPPGGTVLDPFMGSGSTGKAAMIEGFAFVGIEMDETYHTIAKARIEAAAVSLFADIL